MARPTGKRVAPAEWKTGRGDSLEQGGTRPVAKDKHITSLEFSRNGEFFVTGTAGGQVHLFKRGALFVGAEHLAGYNEFCSFSAHRTHFDHVKGTYSAPRIITATLLESEIAPNKHALVAATSKSIRLFSVEGENTKIAKQIGHSYDTDCGDRTPLRNVRAIDVSRTQPYIIAADSQRASLLVMEQDGILEAQRLDTLRQDSSRNGDVALTCIQFRPNTLAKQYAYATSNGVVEMRRIGDGAKAPKVFMSKHGFDSFFGDITRRITDIKFSNDGNYLAVRDLLDLKIFDLRKDGAPLANYPILRHVMPTLGGRYVDGSIFANFDCNWSDDNRYLITGMYDNTFDIIDTVHHSVDIMQALDWPLDLDCDMQYRKGSDILWKQFADEDEQDATAALLRGRGFRPITVNGSGAVVHTAFHPTHNISAVAIQNTTHLFRRMY